MTWCVAAVLAVPAALASDDDPIESGSDLADVSAGNAPIIVSLAGAGAYNQIDMVVKSAEFPRIFQDRNYRLTFRAEAAHARTGPWYDLGERTFVQDPVLGSATDGSFNLSTKTDTFRWLVFPYQKPGGGANPDYQPDKPIFLRVAQTVVLAGSRTVSEPRAIRGQLLTLDTGALRCSPKTGRAVKVNLSPQQRETNHGGQASAVLGTVQGQGGD